MFISYDFTIKSYDRNVTLNVSESNIRKYFMKLNSEITDEEDGPINLTDRTI